MNRRTFLQNSGSLALGAALVAPSAAAATLPKPNRQRVLRAAHLTDIHVMPEMEGFQNPPDGMAAAIRHAQAQADKPELLLFGGDLIMDSTKTEKAKALAQ